MTYPPPYGQYPPPNQPPYGWYPPPQPPRPSGHNGLSIAGMVVGIIALVFLPFGAGISFILSGVGIAMSGVGRVNAQNENQLTSCATAGIACSFSALGLSILLMILLAEDVL